MESPDRSSRAWAATAHLAPLGVEFLFGWFRVPPLFWLLAPLLCWFAAWRGRPFVAKHAHAAVELRLTLLVVFIPGFLVICAVVDPGDGPFSDQFGPLLILVLALVACDVAGSLFGAIQAVRGRRLRYPLILWPLEALPRNARTGFERRNPEA